MDISEILSIALPVVYVIVGAVLVWLVIELVMTVRKTRKTVDDLQRQVEPTLASVERITASLEPVAAKVDPLVERVSLTVDAANLEIMRVDQIMEDVNNITGNVSKATSSVDKVTQAPLNLIAKATAAIRERINPVKDTAEGTAGVVLNNVDNGLEVVGEKVASMQEDNIERRADREAAQAVRDEAMAQTNTTAANLKEAMYIKANADSAGVK